jgi:hypothetical protein
MKGYNTNFNLLEDENILVESSHIYDRKSFPFRKFTKFLAITIYIGMFIIAFFLFFVAFRFSEFTLLLLVIGGLFFIMGLMLIPLIIQTGYFSSSHSKRTIFYVTNQRIVELIKKGHLNRKIHFKEIRYKDLDYLIKNMKTLSFHKKIIFQVPFYALNDEVYKSEPQEQEKIVIHLEGTLGKNVWEEIKAYLFPMIPLIPHPRLKFIIVNKNFVTPKDNF